ILILFNIGYAFSAANFATLDGPCHLYTSSLFNSIRTDSFIQANYNFTGIITPNFLSHYILSILFNFFSQGESEKIFICFYFVMVPITFRYAVKLYSKQESNFSLLIFPILYNFLLHLGFYNINLALVFFNIHLILSYHLLMNRGRWYIILSYFINSFLLYYSHAFIFSLAIALTVIIIIVYSDFNFRSILRKALVFLSLSIIPIIFLIYFFTTSNIINFHSDLPKTEKLQRIVMCTPIIVSGVAEHVYVFIILGIMILLSVIILYKNYIRKDKPTTFLIFAVLIFFMMLFVEDGMFTGMMTDRLVFVFFYIIIFWISCYKITSKWLYLLCSSVLLYSFVNLYFIKKTVVGDIGADAKKVFFASKYVKPHSYVFNVNLTENWLEYHFGNYLANNKPIVFINDNHASFAWFPFTWKNPRLIEQMVESVTNYDSLNVEKLPDYVFVTGNQLKLDDQTLIKKCIRDHGEKIYSSEDNYCVLYKLNK
ncbi:MAG: hypothetical protein ABIP51_04020, partial [Bacteroidia bacterium]